MYCLKIGHDVLFLRSFDLIIISIIQIHIVCFYIVNSVHYDVLKFWCHKQMYVQLRICCCY
jgi:hypothetical protein